MKIYLLHYGKKIKRQDEFFVNGQKVRATQAIVKPNDIIEYNLPVTSKVRSYTNTLKYCL